MHINLRLSMLQLKFYLQRSSISQITNSIRCFITKAISIKETGKNMVFWIICLYIYFLFTRISEYTRCFCETPLLFSSSSEHGRLRVGFSKRVKGSKETKVELFTRSSTAKTTVANAKRVPRSVKHPTRSSRPRLRGPVES